MISNFISWMQRHYSKELEVGYIRSWRYVITILILNFKVCIEIVSRISSNKALVELGCGKWVFFKIQGLLLAMCT